MDNKTVHDLLQELRNNELKYGYYILAVNLACIGYIVDRTTGLKVNQVDVFLGISIICFTTSFIVGLKFISLFNKVLNLNIGQQELINWTSVIYRKYENINPKLIQDELLKSVEQKGIDISKKHRRLKIWILLLFSLGAVFYFLWKLLVILNIETVCRLS